MPWPGPGAKGAPGPPPPCRGYASKPYRKKLTPVLIFTVYSVLPKDNIYFFFPDIWQIIEKSIFPDF